MCLPLLLQKPYKIVFMGLILFVILLTFFNSPFGFNGNIFTLSKYNGNEAKTCNYKINYSVKQRPNATIITELIKWNFLKSHPNLPKFLLMKKDFPSIIPPIQSIRWVGIHWQESGKGYPKFLLYSAHYDNYHVNKGIEKSFIYVLGLYDGDTRPNNYYFQLYMNDTSPVFSLPVLSYVLIDWQGFSSDYLVPYLLICAVPNHLEQEYIPTAVSLVRTPCDVPTNLLEMSGVRKNYNNRNRNDTVKPPVTVGICGPALYYFEEDFSLRLIEWIELLNHIGVSKIILYKTFVHENIEKVLNYYEKKGLVTIVSFHYPPPYVDEPSLRRVWTQTKRRELFALENVYFTDCILRFKDQFNYLGHFDPDEMIILKKHKTLVELIQELRNQYDEESLPTSFGLKWKVFYSDIKPGNLAKNISKDFYMLRHNRRISKIITPYDDNMKSIYDTSRVRAVYSHKPLLFIDGTTHGKTKVVDPDIAYTAHFRIQTCGSKCLFQNLVEENSLLKKSQQIISIVRQVQSELHLH